MMSYDDEWEKEHPSDCCCHAPYADPNPYCPTHGETDRVTSACIAILICLMAIGLICALPWIA